ncbi:NAD(P)/FAD-dependent oxidoreductase [Haloplasma contractile]|uniref:Ferredoxin--NADP reductase n=1 Tax=Haloplasma contractile SSD-17B TaxID=1033810 RepID=U2FQS7_9MOLU|nr:NAD(P)/FAD-dependent oxidoreductase [Haloplasma contractile]ERJ13374.1 Ferredoxin--NADP reductase 2 protein [Haloplasma contractile SSD-17B]
MINHAYDLTIIGAGPVGMYAAFYAGLRGMKVKIIDALPELGGQLQAIYPEKYIYDAPGYDEVLAGDLIKNIKKQMDTVGEQIEVVLQERVEYVKKREEDGFFEICTNKICHYSKTVLITAGKGAFKPRPLGVENEDSFNNIHYFVNDMSKFKGKRVAIFGGGDSAVDWANMLNGVSKEVTIIHRRDKFRAHAHSVEQMNNSDVDVLTPFSIDSLEGENGKVSKVTIKEAKNAENTKTLEVDDLIVLFGFLSSLGPIEDWDLELEQRALLVDSRHETNIRGIFAAGDSCTYNGKVKMITSGFGESTVAVNSAFVHINPDKKNAPVFSSALKK